MHECYRRCSSSVGNILPGDLTLRKKTGDNEDMITNLMWHVNDFAFEALNAKQYFTELLAQSSKNIFSLIFGFYALVSFIFFNIFISGEPVDYVACFLI